MLYIIVLESNGLSPNEKLQVLYYKWETWHTKDLNNACIELNYNKIQAHHTF